MVRNLRNHKVYIGKTIRSLHERRRAHIKVAKYNTTNQAFHSAIRKYPKIFFKWYILNSNAKTPDELNKLEIEYIASYKNRGVVLYNMTNGGDGNTRTPKPKAPRVPEEIRRMKISNTLKGRVPWNKGIKTGSFKNKELHENRNRIADIRKRAQEIKS